MTAVRRYEEGEFAGPSTRTQVEQKMFRSTSAVGLSAGRMRGGSGCARTAGGEVRGAGSGGSSENAAIARAANEPQIAIATIVTSQVRRTKPTMTR
jgi:hypothetical protein